MRRTFLILVALLLVCGIGTVVWTLAGLPQVKHYLRYGLNPSCAPTGETLTVEGVEFVEIGPGIFRMGSTYLAEGGGWLGKICAPLGLPWGKHPKPSDEMPVHWVEFRTGFWIATTEVTNDQYERFDKDHDRHHHSEGDDTPVVDVSWEDAKDYCAWLAEKAKRPIRLPSEAEWECACRAGSDDEFTFGDDEASIGMYAWYRENADHEVHAVATKRPNRWGLHDLHGNVWEWCEDAWHGSYDDAPTDGSPWTEGGEVWHGSPTRAFRGGYRGGLAEGCRSAIRSGERLAFRMMTLGFRPAFVPGED